MKTSHKLSPAKQLGALLRTARPEGMSQERLAEVIGTKQPVVSRYERGQAIPSSRHLSALIQVLDLDAEGVYALVRRHYQALDREGNGGAAA